MKNFASKVQRFLKSEDGPTAVEYAVMLALIVVVCLGAITSIGHKCFGDIQRRCQPTLSWRRHPARIWWCA